MERLTCAYGVRSDITAAETAVTPLRGSRPSSAVGTAEANVAARPRSALRAAIMAKEGMSLSE